MGGLICTPLRRISDSSAASALFAPLIAERVEIVAFAYLDEDKSLLAVRQGRSTRIDALDFSIREVASDALAFGANAVVMAHNHPSGDPTPSKADREATSRLATTLDLLGVRLMDHLVLASGGVTSFRILGLL